MADPATPAIPADALGPLPEWNLADLYPDPDGPDLAGDLAEAYRRAAAFEARIRGRLADLTGDALAAAVREFEAIDEICARLLSFAALHYATDVEDPARGRFLQSIQERVNDISAHTLFFASS